MARIRRTSAARMSTSAKVTVVLDAISTKIKLFRKISGKEGVPMVTGGEPGPEVGEPPAAAKRASQCSPIMILHYSTCAAHTRAAG
jgi:hypothetical protein